MCRRGRRRGVRRARRRRKRPGRFDRRGPGRIRQRKNERAARRKSSLAFDKSPSCDMAIPRKASAGASSRSAIRSSAPKGSPALSARPAAVMSESMAHLMTHSTAIQTRHTFYSHLVSGVSNLSTVDEHRNALRSKSVFRKGSI